jgi:hypothetical protein
MREKNDKRKLPKLFGSNFQFFTRSQQSFARFFRFLAASANDIFYCSHVSKLFYDDANPINVRTFQYRSMFICHRQSYFESSCSAVRK